MSIYRRITFGIWINFKERNEGGENEKWEGQGQVTKQKPKLSFKGSPVD